MDLELYGGADPREQSRYTYQEAARATGIPASTLRAWTVGMRYQRKIDHGFFVPVLKAPSPDDSRLSYVNLIEAHILRALRTVHDVRLERIREAVAIAEQELGIPRLLVDPRLKAAEGRLFLERYGDYVELSRSQQLTMRLVLEMYLSRIEYDASRLPAEFFPFEGLQANAGKKVILISPFISFGRPVVSRVGISTRAIAQRVNAGESIKSIADDYGLEDAELEEAIFFESAA